MKKLFISLVFCISLLPKISYAQDEPNQVYLSASKCVSADGYGTATLHGVVDTVIGWTGRGDVSVDWNTDTRGVSFLSTGYGKGCLTVRYMAKGSDSCSCASSTSIDIYKSFNLPDTIGIEGPSCVSPGQIVVYSIEPIVTRNINDRIGIDGYYWNIGDLVRANNSFVDSVYYISGDSSSITFKVKDWDDNLGPNEISVIVGRCNKNNPASVRTLNITKQAPKPEFGFDYMCIPYGNEPFTINIQNASSNVEYIWSKPIDWEFVAFNSDSTSATIRPNKTSPDTISVSAIYKNNKGIECAVTKNVLQIYRRWGTNVYIDGPTCTSIGGGTYRYNVMGDIPTGTRVRWEIPATWAYEGDLASPLLKAYPTSSAGLTDTIRVFELSKCELSDIKSTTFAVNVRPVSVYLSGEQCVEIGHTYTYRVHRKNDAVGPNAQQYHWYINGILNSNLTADTANITISSDTKYIQVLPLGNNGCNGSISDTLKIMVSPSSPTGIALLNPATCISAGMEDTISLRILGAVSSQDYVWGLNHTSNWQVLNYPTANHSEVLIRTSGVAGSDTIEAYTLGNGLCSNTDTVQIILTTSVVPYGIEIEERSRYYDFYSNPQDLTTVPEFSNETLYYTWLINGIIEDEGYDATDISIRKNLLSTSDIVSLIIQTISGCKYLYSTQIADAIIPENAVNNPSYTLRKIDVSDEKTRRNMTISPNPVQSQLYVLLPQTAEHSIIRIYDISGKLIKRIVTQEDSVVIPVDDIPNGTYSLILNQSGDLTSERFIVNH